MNPLHPHPSSSWLGFSLSNHNHNLSLFEAFHHPHSRTDLSTVLINCNPNTTTTGPKLEDFLGGATNNNNNNNNNGTCTNETTPSTSSSSSSSTTPSMAVAYDDSELKSIAATFLRGYTTTTTTTTTTTPLPSDPPPPPAAAAAVKKSTETFGQRTSIYRGVTRHRWTGRYEAHLWDNTCRREGQSRKGRQVYLGGYDKEEKAARAYDLAALKYWGPTTTTNFPVSNYEKEIEEMQHMSRQEFVASLRRKSSGFSRGASIYRGVTRHHQHGRWQARIGRVAGNKDLYLGTFSTQEEAAEAYDIAAIKFRGLNAVTNFDISRYDVKSIATSNLPIGGGGGSSLSSKITTTTTSPDQSTTMSNHHHHHPGATATVIAPALLDHNFSTTTTSHLPMLSSSSSAASLAFSLPVKQQQHDHQDSHFWTSLVQQQYEGSGFKNIEFPTTTPTLNPISAAAPDEDGDNSAGYFSMGGGTSYYEQQNRSTESGMELVTRIGLNSSSRSKNSNSTNSSSYVGSGSNSSYGNWLISSSSSPSSSTVVPVQQQQHSFQAAKQNLSVVFQTPIFGME